MVPHHMMMQMDMEDSYGEDQYYDEEMDEMDPMAASGDTEGGAVYQYGN